MEIGIRRATNRQPMLCLLGYLCNWAIMSDVCWKCTCDLPNLSYANIFLSEGFTVFGHVVGNWWNRDGFIISEDDSDDGDGDGASGGRRGKQLESGEGTSKKTKIGMSESKALRETQILLIESSSWTSLYQQLQKVSSSPGILEVTRSLLDSDHGEEALLESYTRNLHEIGQHDLDFGWCKLVFSSDTKHWVCLKPVNDHLEYDNHCM